MGNAIEDNELSINLLNNRVSSLEEIVDSEGNLIDELIDSISNLDSSKQDNLDTQVVYTELGTSTKVPQISTNDLGQVTNITEVDIDLPTNVSDLTNDLNYITDSEGNDLVNIHNTDSNSHSDIRQLISDMSLDIDDIDAFIHGLCKSGKGISVDLDDEGKFIINETCAELTLLAANWVANSSEGYPFSNTVQLTGISSVSEPMVDIKIPHTVPKISAESILSQWDKVYSVESQDDLITFYATDVPTDDLSVIVKGY